MCLFSMWGEIFKALVLLQITWWSNVSTRLLMGFWQHIHSGCLVCIWSIQYHIYRIVKRCWLSGCCSSVARALVAEVSGAGFDSQWLIPIFFTFLFQPKGWFTYANSFHQLHCIWPINFQNCITLQQIQCKALHHVNSVKLIH